MSIIFLLIPLSVVIATGFLIAFIWAVRSGQYEDTCTPSMRLLMPDGTGEGAADTLPAPPNPRARAVPKETDAPALSIDEKP